MKLNIKKAIIPKNKTDPTGVARLEAGAKNLFERKINLFKRYAIKKINRYLNYQSISANAERYYYDIDPDTLSDILEDLGVTLDEIMLEGGKNNEFFQEYVNKAYRRGTAQEYSNLAHQYELYAEISLESLMRTRGFLRRVELIQSRTFEEMKGFTSETKKELGRVLANGIIDGKPIKDITASISERLNVAKSRANRIAQTEVTMAQKRARIEESEEAQDRLGFRTMLMHLSALLPTTRATHAERHRRLYTHEQVREFYSKDANAINCHCSVTSVIVDEKGRPVSPYMREYAILD